MARKQVRDPLFGAAPVLQPQARPVDTFVSPSSTPPVIDTRLGDLGSALAGIGDSLVSAGAAAGDRQDKVDNAQAKRDHRRKTQTLNAAVGAGLLPFSASPAYLRGLAEAQLGSLGNKFRTGILEAFGKSPAQHSDDPEAVQEFTRAYQAGFAEENLGSYDALDVANFFERAEMNAIKEIQAQHANMRLAAKADAGENVLTQKIADLYASYNAVPLGERDVAALTDDIAKVLNPLVEGNLTYFKFPQKRANKAGIIAAVESAIAFDDLTMLDAIRNVPTGKGGRLGEIAEYKKLLRAAEDEIVKNEFVEMRREAFLLDKKVSAIIVRDGAAINRMIEAEDYDGAIKLIGGDMTTFAPGVARAYRNDVIARQANSFVVRATTLQISEIYSAARRPGMTRQEMVLLTAQVPAAHISTLWRTFDIMRQNRPYFSDRMYGAMEVQMHTILKAKGEAAAGTGGLRAARDIPEADADFEQATADWMIANPGKQPNRAELKDIMISIVEDPRFGILVENEIKEEQIDNIVDRASKTDYHLIPDWAKRINEKVKEVKSLEISSGYARKWDAAQELLALYRKADEALVAPKAAAAVIAFAAGAIAAKKAKALKIEAADTDLIF